MPADLSGYVIKPKTENAEPIASAAAVADRYPHPCHLDGQGGGGHEPSVTIQTDPIPSLSAIPNAKGRALRYIVTNRLAPPITTGYVTPSKKRPG